MAAKDPALNWSDLDKRAVDTVRVLAMDAVEKAGNGHPGHRDEPRAGRIPAVQPRDAARPDRSGLGRPGPLRALLRALQPHPLHPALPLRVRPGAGRPGLAAPVGLADPRPPGARAHPRRRGHHRPARARASATRSAWRWPPAASAACSTRTTDPGQSPFDHHIYAIVLGRRHRGGRQPRVQRDRRGAEAGQPHADLRRQRDLHRGRHPDRQERGRRRPLRRVRLGRAARRLAHGRPGRGRLPRGRRGALRRRSWPPRR